MALVCVLATGCPLATPVDLTERPLFDDGVNVFEAQVVDGLTGTLIVNATVRVQVGRHFLDANNDNGFYTVYGIPPGSFRITVTADGYNDFRAVRSFTRNGRLSRGDPLGYTFNNILMYQIGQVPGDLIVSVYDGTSGDPVADATVLASLDDVTPLVDVSDPLAPNVGILPPTLAVVTGADGKATFTRDVLVMNGFYLVDVYGALDASGVYLVPVSNRSITVGQQVQEIVIFLSRPSLSPVAIKANNEDSSVLVNELVVTFPYAIELCSTDADHGWSNTTSSHTLADSDGDGTVTSPAATSPVTASLAGDTVLTLTFATENNDAGDALWVTFYGVRLKPRGASDSSCTSLGSVALRNTVGFPTVDAEIHVRNAP